MEKPAEVLLVDDNPLSVRTIIDLLNEHSYHVTVARSGKECLEIAALMNPDIILLDILMPDIDGIETCKRLKSNPSTASLPIIFLSALDGQLNIMKGFSAGGVDYVTKPVQEGVLLARLKTHVTLKRLRELLQIQNHKLQQEVKKRKIAQENVAGQYDFMKTVINSIPHPLYVIDVNNYNILLANSAAEKRGISCGKPCYYVTHKREKPCNAVEHKCPLREFKTSLKPIVLEHQHYDADGNPRYVELHGCPILDHKGNMIQMIECTVDITERKKMAEAREQLLTELQNAVDQVKLLSGIIPICAYCKEIRDDQGYWNNLEKFISDHSEAMFSHSICPKCMEKHFPEDLSNKQSEIDT